MKDSYGKTSTGMTKFTKGMTKRFNNAGANLSRVGSNLISSNKKKNDVSLNFFIKWGMPSRWSFHPISAWGSIGTTTMRKMRPTLGGHTFDTVKCFTRICDPGLNGFQNINQDYYEV